MSAELLRRAAALMRERAQDTTAAPWSVGGTWWLEGVQHTAVESFGELEAAFTYDASNAEHIASWHPAVALAVADWLEVAARVDDEFGHDLAFAPALAVARAYLGDS